MKENGVHEENNRHVTKSSTPQIEDKITNCNVDNHAGTG